MASIVAISRLLQMLERVLLILHLMRHQIHDLRYRLILPRGPPIPLARLADTMFLLQMRTKLFPKSPFCKLRLRAARTCKFLAVALLTFTVFFLLDYGRCFRFFDSLRLLRRSDLVHRTRGGIASQVSGLATTRLPECRSPPTHNRHILILPIYVARAYQPPLPTAIPTFPSIEVLNGRAPHLEPTRTHHLFNLLEPRPERLNIPHPRPMVTEVLHTRLYSRKIVVRHPLRFYCSESPTCTGIWFVEVLVGVAYRVVKDIRECVYAVACASEVGPHGQCERVDGVV
ncbi:hypothetical protein BC629DRAFT_1534872 [Irpex lacteus]|nr:hypothetical protein BC629DRAFT_1534872 [Irpex lacteus]